jgi:hypothetical protein
MIELGVRPVEEKILRDRYRFQFGRDERSQNAALFQDGLEQGRSFGVNPRFSLQSCSF